MNVNSEQLRAIKIRETFCDRYITILTYTSTGAKKFQRRRTQAITIVFKFAYSLHDAASLKGAVLLSNDEQLKIETVHRWKSICFVELPRHKRKVRDAVSQSLFRMRYQLYSHVVLRSNTVEIHIWGLQRLAVTSWYISQCFVPLKNSGSNSIQMYRARKDRRLV